MPVGIELVFVAGPNAGCGNLPIPDVNNPGMWKAAAQKQDLLPQVIVNTTGRTLNKAAEKCEHEFVHGIRQALRAGFDGMIAEGIQVAIITGVSTGIYAGPHKKLVSPQSFELIVADVLREVITFNTKTAPKRARRGQFFLAVWYPTLDRFSCAMPKALFQSIAKDAKSIFETFPMLRTEATTRKREGETLIGTSSKIAEEPTKRMRVALPSQE